LGIGGVRFLREAGIAPAVFHMNEGHAAFLTIELMREEFQKTKSLQKCEERVRKQCVFTTHTPVPAGHDKFPRDLFEFTMHSYAERLKLSVDDLLAYGNLDGDRNMFTMTILALKLARSANGVSRKHGEVSREMWKELYNVENTKKVPIGYITNGIHVPTWAAQTTQAFWSRNGGEDWSSKLLDAAFWKKLVGPGGVSDAELWSLRAHLRRQLIDFIRHRAKTQQSIVGGFGEDNIPRLLSPDALTIGYARRFAQYKRAPMIFRDSSRLEKLLNNPSRPVQLIFAGKAHPKDEGGKNFIHEIIEYTRHPHFFGKVVFIENYDMNVARHLISGCDIWLNTPRKPLEACGTSGEKTAINGGLHFSIRDGWWDEAYDGKNGWAIDDAEDAKSPEEQDEHDAESLYQTLESDIVPLFFKRDKEGVPQGWLTRIRQAIRTIVPVYNTDRMVAEYIEKYYFPE
jgi:starch phosphorylase